MDYTAFWNIVPTAAVSLLMLGMGAFTLVNFGRARAAGTALHSCSGCAVCATEASRATHSAAA